MIKGMWRAYADNECSKVIIELRCGALEECNFVSVTPGRYDNTLSQVEIRRLADRVWKDVHDRFVSDNVCGFGMCYVTDNIRRYLNKKKIVTNVGKQSVLNPRRGRQEVGQNK